MVYGANRLLMRYDGLEQSLCDSGRDDWSNLTVSPSPAAAVSEGWNSAFLAAAGTSVWSPAWSCPCRPPLRCLCPPWEWGRAACSPGWSPWRLTEEVGGAHLLRPRGGIWPPLQWRKEMQEDLREREERVNHTHAITHTHLICHVLKVCLTNSLWVSLFEGQRRGEELEVSHRNVRHV